MTNAEARAIFDSVIAKETDSDKIAKAELLREYFCNEAFRLNLQDYVAKVNGL